MLTRIMANTSLKKAMVFSAVFALTGVLMGNALMGFRDTARVTPTIASVAEEDMDRVWRAESGSYEEFVRIIQSANREQDGVSSESSRVFPDSPQQEAGGQAEFVYLSDIPLSKELQEFTWSRCEELDLEYELILAVMWRESRFQVDAVGHNTNGTRDNGIMQINDVNRGWLRDNHGITDLMDPYQNITAGTLMLAEYMKEYGDESRALMAYHYGKAGMHRKVAQGMTTNAQVVVAQEKRDDYRAMLASV